MVGAALRWSRALTVATCAWGVSGAAHVLGGAPVPSPVEVAALVALTAWPLSLLLGRQAGVARLLLLLTLAQAGMHVALVLAAQAGAGLPAGAVAHGHPAGTGHVSGGSAALGAAELPATMADMPGMALVPGLGMLLAHLVAAAVLAVLLAGGERSLFGLLRVLSRAAGQVGRRRRPGFAAVLAALVGAPARQRPPGGGEVRGDLPVPWQAVTQFLARAVPRRGPPAIAGGPNLLLTLPSPT